MAKMTVIACDNCGEQIEGLPYLIKVTRKDASNVIHVGMQYIRNLLCWLGWHRYEFKDTATALVVTTWYRCRNEQCTHSRTWRVVNIETRHW